MILVIINLLELIINIKLYYTFKNKIKKANINKTGKFKYINPIAKLEIESIIKITWVFSYTEQKAVTKYKKNKNRQDEKKKKIIILILRYFIIDLIWFSFMCLSLIKSLIV